MMTALIIYPHTLRFTLDHLNVYFPNCQITVANSTEELEEVFRKGVSRFDQVFMHPSTGDDLKKMLTDNNLEPVTQ